MPVKIIFAIREGWKATQNERFGDVLELRFVNENDGKILWRYAPKLDDEHIFQEAFALLKDYDVKLKELKSLVSRIDGRVYKAAGC